MNRYEINVESFLRTDILGEDLSLPYTEELEERLILHISPRLMDLLDNNANVRNYLVNESKGGKE